MVEQHRTGPKGSDGAASGSDTCSPSGAIKGFEQGWSPALQIETGRGEDPRGAGQGGGPGGQNMAIETGCRDCIDRLRMVCHSPTQCSDWRIIDDDIGIALRDTLCGLPPHRQAMIERIGPGDHRQTFARARSRRLEGVTQQALDVGLPRYPAVAHHRQVRIVRRKIAVTRTRCAVDASDDQPVELGRRDAKERAAKLVKGSNWTNGHRKVEAGDDRLPKGRERPIIDRAVRARDQQDRV